MCRPTCPMPPNPRNPLNGTYTNCADPTPPHQFQASHTYPRSQPTSIPHAQQDLKPPVQVHAGKTILIPQIHATHPICRPTRLTLTHPTPVCGGKFSSPE
mmetsp:Transcript_26293/g.47371  ORF Transcript_26293/g.47371 Transcript_26293/m.47371 type:complete len:100 (+) Transcript_26293:277-576(+)